MAKVTYTPGKVTGPYQFDDGLGSLVNDHATYMIDRMTMAFEYEGLPDTIPKRYAERYILQGVAVVKDVKDKLYIFGGGPTGSCGLGGELDEYYFPTIATIANPYLGISGEYKIGEECEIIRNDPYCKGILPLLSKYGTIIGTADISIVMALITSRMQTIISAADDKTKASAEAFLDGLKKGKLSVIADNSFLDSLKTKDFMSTTGGQVLQSLIELRQYMKAAEFEELGLKTNYNLKREALNQAETSIDEDILRPFIDSMLEERKIGWDKVNSHYGTNVKVRLSSAWKDNQEETELTHKEMGKEEGAKDGDNTGGSTND